MINSAGRVRQCLASEIAIATVFAIAYLRDSRTYCAILWYRPILQAARQMKHQGADASVCIKITMQQTLTD